MKGRFRFVRILAGLLCLFLLVGFLPADILGDLIPETEAAEINYKTWTPDSFNGLFIIRSTTDPSLVLTQPDYFNDPLTFEKLGSVGDIRRQMFVFRSARNSLSTNIMLNTDIYFRCLYDVYRFSETNGGAYGNLWVQSGRADYPSAYPLVGGSDYNAGVPEDSPEGSFAWKLNIYASDTSGDYAGFMKAAICENNTDGDNNGTWRYIIRNTANQAVFSGNTGIYNFSYYFQPVSYGVPDGKNVHLHTSIGTASQYLQYEIGWTANTQVPNYNPNNTGWGTAWSLTQLPNGYHAIVSTQHDRYLAIHGNGNPTLGNQAVTTKGQWNYPQDSEQWQFVPYFFSGQGFTYLIVNKASGRLLLRSASGNTHLCDAYYTASEQCNRWMVTYINQGVYDAASHSNAGYVNPTGYKPSLYSSSTVGINYPINLKTGAGAAQSTYNTLKLNPASTVTGHFSSSDISSGNSTLEGRFKSTSGYVFDSRFITSTAYSNWKQAIDYSGGVIQNTLNNYSGTLISNSQDPHPFKPVGSSAYSASIQFQFEYQPGMFFEYSGDNAGSLNVRVLRKDGYPLYTSSTNGNNHIALHIWCGTPGDIYTIEFTKTSTGDSSSHFKIFTNVQPLTVQNDLDEDEKTKLYDVEPTVYQNGNELYTNAVATRGSLLEYRVKVTNRSVYNLIPLNFQSINPSVPNDVYGDRNLETFSFGSNAGFQPGSAVDASGNSLTADELSYVVYNAAGTPVYTVKDITDSNSFGSMILNLPDGLGGNSYGLPTGWSIELQGVYYSPSEQDYNYSRKLVYFAVDAKLHVPGDNTIYQKTSENTAVHFTNEPFFVQWADKELSVSPELLMQMITASGKHKYEINAGLSKDSISSIILCDYNGNPITSENVSISNATLNLHYKTPGVYQINLKVFYNGTFAMVPTQVFVYDVSEDVTIVLDYGLPVTIDKESYTSDSDFNQPRTKLEIGTAFETTISILQITGTKPGHDGTYLTVTPDLTTAYGTIEMDANNNITYTPTKFLNGADYIYVVFKLERSGSNTKLGVNVADELLMYKTITILPANVIYYEDNLTDGGSSDGFGSILYPTVNDIEKLGVLNGVSGSQNLPAGNDDYGYDDGSYAGSKDVTLSGLGYHKIPVTDEMVTVKFSFTGTGFELISRTNSWDSATILVKVRPVGAGENDWTWYPVITKFNPTNNADARTEVYQVPVFRLNGTEYGAYEVHVVGLPMTDYDEDGKATGNNPTSYIYIDGIRVYNPLGNDDLTDHYGDEQGATFENLRDMILAGNGILTSADDSNKLTGFTTGNYYYVHTDTTRYTAAMGGINELGAVGANNEIYVRKSAGNHIVVLRVKENASGTGLLQIGIRDVHEAMFDGISGDNVGTTVSCKTASGWSVLADDIYHGTEQYYNVDLSSCPSDGEYKVVILRVDSGFASFTNVKHKNVTFDALGDEALDIFVEPGFYFNQNGDMCKIENGLEVIVKENALAELNVIDSLLQNEAE